LVDHNDTQRRTTSVGRVFDSEFVFGVGFFVGKNIGSKNVIQKAEKKIACDCYTHEVPGERQF
jgi:hypothetical protein